MDTLNGYGEMNPVSMYDSELENWLKNCKTQEEKDEAVREYISMKLMAVGAAFLILFASVLVVGAVIYLFR